MLLTGNFYSDKTLAETFNISLKEVYEIGKIFLDSCYKVNINVRDELAIVFELKGRERKRIR